MYNNYNYILADFVSTKIVYNFLIEKCPISTLLVIIYLKLIKSPHKKHNNNIRF